MQGFLDSFFRKRSRPEICEEEMEYREKQQRRSTVSNTMQGSRSGCEEEGKSHKKLKKAFNNLQYDESKQTTFCSVDHEFSTHA